MWKRPFALQSLRILQLFLALALAALLFLLIWLPARGTTQPSDNAALKRLALQQPETITLTNPLTSFPVWRSRERPGDIGNSILAWGDVDGDGDLDLAVGKEIRINSVNFGGGQQLFLNENGALERTPIWWSGAATDDTTGIAWGDVDGDGDLDLAVSIRFGPTKVYRNENGRLQTDQVLLLGNLELSTDLAWADYNQDGFLDLAVTNEDGPNQLYPNQGGTLTNSSVVTFGNESFNSTSLAWADLNNDGWLDLAIGNRNDPNELFLNQNGRLNIENPSSFGRNDPTIALAAADIGEDGFIDLIAKNETPATSKRYAINPRTNELMEIIDWSVDGGSSRTLAWVDLDSDGDVDLLHDNKLYLNQNGRLQTDSDNPLILTSAAHTHLAWGDVDRDGDLDLAATNESFLTLYQNENLPLSSVPVTTELASETEPLNLENGYLGQIAFVDQNGRFHNLHARSLERLGLDRNRYAGAGLSWGDVDGDGDLDLAMARNDTTSGRNRFGTINLYLNQAGQFTRTRLFPSSNGSNIPSASAWGDVDGDGDLDLATGHGDQNYLFVNQDGMLMLEPVWESGDTLSTDSLAWGDMDGDGDLDLAAGNSDGPNSVYLNVGGVLQPFPAWESADADWTMSLAWGDVDGDGDLDLAAGNNTADKVYLNENGRLQTSAIWTSTERRRTLQIAWGDVDGDGDLDLVTPDFTYLNGLAATPARLNNPATLTVSRPADLEGSSFAISTNILTDTIIGIPFTLTDPENEPIARIEAEYSLNGGGQWFPALPAANTVTTHLQTNGRSYTFQWDTFASNFFGQSDNVLFRINAFPQAPSSSTVITGTFRYTNSVALPAQRPFLSATTAPFRVRGTQVQVVSSALTQTVPAPNASVYLLREGNQTALLMGTSNRPFVTNGNGILNGRGSIQQGDQLFAMQPISQEFRIPPQLAFGGNGVAETELSDLSTNQLTAEFWLHPRSLQATPLTLGNVLTLTYATLAETTALTLTAPGQTLTHQFPLHNGLAHHLALSWDGETGGAALIVNGETAVSNTIPLEEAPPLSFSSLQIGQDFTGAIDEIRLWNTVRTAEQISATRFTTSLTPTDSLIGYWPITADDREEIADHSGHNRPLTLAGETAVGYKPLYTFYHTSGIIDATTPLNETVNGVQFTEVVSPGLQQLTASADNPLILFDLDVSLEWDARNDNSFLRDLEDSFRDASALLYDVTNGQVALGQINLFHDKAYWGVADIVIYADNALRPSAAIGGVVNERTQEPALSDMEEAAYLPGQIRMGTSWDPYGENTADLGVEWSRALAHELAHYLLFLPDNYLGIDQEPHEDEDGELDHEDDEDEDNARGGIFRRVVCPGSFMTTTSDPNFSEFLTEAEWLGACQDTIAQITTGRNDWETITEFYPQLNAPTQAIDGPTDLPLAVTYMLPWAFAEDALPFPARNFDVRTADGSQERLRLPSAQAYLIKQHRRVTETTNVDFTNDQLILLGTPVGGGDRLDVRGAEEGDQLCLYDGIQGYAGCIGSIDGNTVAVPAAPIWPALGWQPQISTRAVDATTVAITITQPLTEGDQIAVQLFPIHYGSVSRNAPIHVFTDASTDTHAVTLQMVLPAYETAVRVWTLSNDTCNAQVAAANEQAQTQNENEVHEPWRCTREALFTTRLNPTDWNPTTNLPQTGQNRSLQYAPFTFGPDSSLVGGPDSSLVGGPDSSLVGGVNLFANPDSSLVGGPDSSLVGGPDSSLVGGAGRVLLGNPDSSLVGGALLLANPDSSLVGGPDSSLVGGPDSSLVGGAAIALLGNPDSSLVGGTNLIGNPDSSLVGGGSQEATAPILSADAKVVIYSADGLFADNGVESIQALATVPQRDTHRWLLPVGQAYRVTLRDIDAPRFISFSYLQRDVPDGFEQSLAVYFLPNGGDQWERQVESSGFVENLIVSQLQPEDGIYAVMATVQLPQLTGGEWGLIPYLMPDCRPAEEGLAAIWARVDSLVEAENPFMIDTAVLESLPNQDETVRDLQPNTYYWVRLTPGDPITPFLAPPQRLPNGEFRTCSPTEPAEPEDDQ